jgi:hypothetical protein
VRRRGARARRSQALERGGGSPDGASGPRARRQDLERGKDFVARHMVLQRGRDSPEEYRSSPFGGIPQQPVRWAIMAFWAVDPSALGRSHKGKIRKGHFPRLLEEPYDCPRQAVRSRQSDPCCNNSDAAGLRWGK